MTALDFTSDDRVSIDVADHVAYVRLTRADKMNALDPAMFERIIAAGTALRSAKGVRAVVLSGEGRAFCAGLDTASFGAQADPDAPPLQERTYGNANKYQEVAMTWRKCPVPVIAALHGVCFGGGLQIASGADIRIAHPATRMAVMEMKWGLVPDMGGFALWRGNVRDDVLRELTYTAREFLAEEGKALGFVTELADDPLARAEELATAIAGRNPGAIRAAKQLANTVPDIGEDAILLAEAEAQAGVIRTPNQIEAVMAELQGRAANYAD
ncbi:crotonase/enoyl-CoA hydratase family protein [Alteriqipengyuania flavescens]|uniref:crotonase/enoyl-CoA hydratase family protein n=1 Tax=Alteriqipengyuania flavescens TaxID=3053610 RepID=UPI0025B46E4B|nr:crotonase/enoyl-CoA hydratase family protein [Alteriqipengyuania flavescens]WJY17530.1 crotonase/enoyl-CoA hydratase family protein [Alteriqipengyuania flavescens]WJY23473.1 crotonase/enoyl-CoA hydratase family protein [Alteriqipengyuania flavescens]